MRIFFLIPFMIVLLSCIGKQTGLIKNKKWRMVKQLVSTQDKKGTTNNEKLKDFVQFDSLDFNSGNKMTGTSYGDQTIYGYSIKDSILTLWPEKDVQKINEYRILRSTKDSLILKCSEIWGAGADLKITVTFHLAAVLDKS